MNFLEAIKATADGKLVGKQWGCSDITIVIGKGGSVNFSVIGLRKSITIKNMKLRLEDYLSCNWHELDERP